MAVRIQLIGKDAKHFQFIHKALDKHRYALDFVSFSELEKQPDTFATAQLLILNTLPYPEKSFGQFYLLKEHPLLSKLPLLALVREDPPRLRYRLFQMGLDEYLTAPFDKLDLQMRIRSLLRRRQSEQQQLFAEQVLNQLNFGLLVINEDRRIKHLNEHAATLLHLQADDALGQPLNMFLNETTIREILENAHPRDLLEDRPEIEMKNIEGQKIAVGFSVQPFEGDRDGENGFIISLKDITQTKKMREEMRRMDRLASLGVLASGIAHEIRNPLAGIKAMVQTFQDEFEPQDNRNEYLNRIVRLVNRMDELLRALFSYARPPKPDRQSHQVEHLLSDVLSLTRQKFREKRIQYQENREGSLPDIYVDSGQIQQVLFNLFFNSIDAVSEQGEITVTLRPFMHSESNDPHHRFPYATYNREWQYLELCISDNGSGISQQHMKQIFNPFFTTKSFGTGLGLSIVYQIVKENNGFIIYESEVDKGTDCFLYLPASDNQELTNKKHA